MKRTCILLALMVACTGIGLCISQVVKAPNERAFEIWDMAKPRYDESKHETEKLHYILQTSTHRAYESKVLDRFRERAESAFVKIIKDYQHRNVFGEISLVRNGDRWSAIVLQVHTPGRDSPLPIVIDQIDAAKIDHMWESLNKLGWKNRNVFTRYYQGDSSSGPLYCLVGKEGEDDKFFCIAYGHNNSLCVDFLDAIIDCVGRELFFGKFYGSL